MTRNDKKCDIRCNIFYICCLCCPLSYRVVLCGPACRVACRAVAVQLHAVSYCMLPWSCMRLRGGVLCYVMLCYVMLCYVVLCCAVLCCFVLFFCVFCLCVVLCFVYVLFMCCLCVVLCCVVLCPVVSRLYRAGLYWLGCGSFFLCCVIFCFFFLVTANIFLFRADDE